RDRSTFAFLYAVALNDFDRLGVRSAAESAAVVNTGRDRVGSRFNTAQIPGNIRAAAYDTSARDGVVVGKHVIFRIACRGRDADRLIVVTGRTFFRTVARFTRDINRRFAKRDRINVSELVLNFSLAFVAASDECLEDISMRVGRRNKACRHSGVGRPIDRRFAAGSVLANYDIGTRNDDIGTADIVEILISTAILLVYVIAVSQAESEPAGREDTRSENYIHRIILECIRRTAANILHVAEFSDRLNVFVRREINSDRSHQFIRTVEQRRAARFNVRIVMISNVTRKVHPFRQASADEECSAEITAVAARARTALKLVEA